MNFIDINIKDKTKDALAKLGYVEMMPIQAETINPILEGNDIVGQAQTGTGKTAAFVIPIIEKINKDSEKTEHLVVAPTRELAIQIVDEFRKIGERYNFKIATIVGGMNISRQKKTLSAKPDVIVATPGRIIDHLKRKRIDLGDLKTFVIDEVDEMFKSGFKEEIDEIITFLPDKKQTLLFSATISSNVKKIANKTCINPKYISVSNGSQTTKNVTQKCVVVKENEKFKTLLTLLSIDKPNLTVIFGRTKRRSKELGKALIDCGYKAESLHGDLNQSQRNIVMKKFKNKDIDILVATDVAARGIDANGVTHIYNFDLPQEIEFYVHRIGRTGRANSTGFATSLVRMSELGRIDRIRKETNSKIEFIELNNNHEHATIDNNQIIKSIEKMTKNTNIKNNVELIEELQTLYTNEQLISILIDKLATKIKYKDISLTAEPPIKAEKVYNNKKGSFKKDYKKRNNFNNTNRNVNPKRKSKNRNNFKNKRSKFSK